MGDGAWGRGLRKYQNMGFINEAVPTAHQAPEDIHHCHCSVRGGGISGSVRGLLLDLC
jgi:hypothetical protein